MSLSEPIPECLSCKDPSYVFVYGANKRGRNGAGAALHAAREHGALEHMGFGASGNAFAIPTKDEWLQVMSLSEIHRYVLQFLEYAKANPQKKFFVTALGTGLSGYAHIQIAPMFSNYPTNVTLPDAWQMNP